MEKNDENLSLQNQILMRSSTHGLDSAFTDYDFADLSSAEQLQATLYTMTQNGKLIQALNGESVYIQPDALEKVSETIIIMRCVEALSRKFMWKSIPSGVFALISVGLEKEKKPLSAEFITDAPDSVYASNTFKIIFHHTEFPAQGSLSTQAEYILQIFTALGHEKVTAASMEHLKKTFTDAVLKRAAIEIKSAPGTPFQIKELIKKSVYGRA